MLKVRRLSKSFGGLAALRDVEFAVAPGEIKAVIGPNGAGKTTLFNVVTGLLKPTAGSIEFAGRAIAGLPPARIARMGIGRTFQQPQVFRSLTVLENVMLGAHRGGHGGLVSCGLGMPAARAGERHLAEAAREQLAFMGLAAGADRIASELPLGKQRYVEIARALATGARLVLLDEPAAGLDETETNELHDLILRIRDIGVTVLLIEHHMRFVMSLADNVLVLNFGAPLEEGPPQAIRRSRAVIEAYLGAAVDA
ncbi:MAG: ABC transporter ATP-binding protein [Burkholderiales bacterium]|nr:MAG: ABC transporter ATP-binding protein [Burkholderiales bacterium]